jgi:DNA-binding MarR family transcriptional regulator
MLTAFAAPRGRASGLGAARRPLMDAGGGADLDQTGLTHLVGYAATRASLQLKKTFQQYLGPLDLKAVEYSLLVVVANNPGANLKQIGRALEISAPNLAVLIDRLEARGIVKRVRGSADRRQTQVQLTRAGRDLHRRALALAQTMEQDATKVLSDAERALLIELLLRVARVRAT